MIPARTLFCRYVLRDIYARWNPLYIDKTSVLGTHKDRPVLKRNHPERLIGASCVCASKKVSASILRLLGRKGYKTEHATVTPQNLGGFDSKRGVGPHRCFIKVLLRVD
jgi:hypothetical protein